jgi:hypothetical protein
VRIEKLPGPAAIRTPACGVQLDVHGVILLSPRCYAL